MRNKGQFDCFRSGEFFVGANYWASNAGTNMWREFSEEAIHEDFARLSKAHIRTLRVFPNWEDFQPLRILRGAENVIREIRMGEMPLDHTPDGIAGVDPVMMCRFRHFADLAKEFGIRLVVGIVTGWMSGRMYSPAMLAERNLLKDPLAIKWQIKFVHRFVEVFRDHPAIVAWDLGNECNCLSHLEHSEEAYVWTAMIANTIYSQDQSRPVLSGMHSLSPEGIWRMQDQGELLDILCTHPYPLFVRHCDTDPINHMKSILHAAAESRYYADLGGVPCFCEEIGTLGPMYADEETAADYIRAVLWTLYAHDCRGMMWWCANEQSTLQHAPYDWNSVERELGLFRLDGTVKPVTEQIGSFGCFSETSGLSPLPEAIWDTVCVLTHGQDNWAAAYGAFILAKQAGLNLRFAWCEGPIPHAMAYLIPCMGGDSFFRLQVYKELFRRSREEGATLYLSIDDALLNCPEKTCGIRVVNREKSVAPEMVCMNGNAFSLKRAFKIHSVAQGSQVLAETEYGEPAFTRFDYGKGRVFLMQFPIEIMAASIPGMTYGDESVPLYKFYEVLDIASSARTAHSMSPTTGLTEHIVDENHRTLILINYEPNAARVRVRIDDPWRAERAIAPGGDVPLSEEDGGFALDLGKNTGAAVIIVKKAKEQ